MHLVSKIVNALDANIKRIQLFTHSFSAVYMDLLLNIYYDVIFSTITGYDDTRHCKSKFTTLWMGDEF